MVSRGQILELDKRFVFRPFTSVDDHLDEDSLVVTHATGPYLFDKDGRKIFDASGAWWCNHLGFQHPRLVTALRDQASHLCHVAMSRTTHEHAARLAEELVAVAPDGLSRVFFADNGSTAVEIATKIAFQYWQQNGRPERKLFVTLSGGYHGDTIGAMSVGGVESFHRTFSPLFFDVLRAPDASDVGFEAVFDWIVKAIRENADRVAGVVLEPIVQAAGGMRFYDPAFLRRVREEATRHDTFLIADEVFTGFGRTGPMWACDRAEVAPDLLCTAKGLSGGVLPFGAVLVSGRIHEGFRGDKSRAFLHGHTFCGHPLGARVAREVLAIYRDEAVLDAAAGVSATLARRFEAFGSIPGVRNTRTLGCIAALELGAEGYFGGRGWAVADEALRRGVAVRPLGDTLYLVPPLNTPEADLDAMLDRVEESLRARAT